METTIDAAQKPWSWLEIWQNSLLHPTTRTYSRISSDPRSSIKWGLTWAAITTLVAWAVGPQRELIGGYIANVFGGRETFLYVSVIGAPIAIILGVLGFVLLSAIVHGLAHWFKGTGTFPN